MAISNSGITADDQYNAGSVAIRGGTIDGTPIGGTTAAAGRFTTVTATTGVVGVTDGSNAGAGYVGEYIGNSLQSGSAVSVTSDNNTSIVSVSLTAGDWDVSGCVAFRPAGGANVTFYKAGTNSGSTSFGGLGTFFEISGAATATVDQYFPIPTIRWSLSGATTIYLVVRTNFTVGTMTAFGLLGARRVR
jgi:hypothetical protein